MYTENMTKVREFLKQYWVVLMAILLGGIFRIVFLSSLPTSLTGDELVYVLNAKLFFLGSDFLDGWNPLLAFIFHYPPGIFPQAELPYLISLLTSFSSSLFSIRLPYVVMSVGIIAILYFLGKELFEEKSARWIAFVAAVNPWFIIMGRTSYEMTPATLFYLLGIYILLKAKKTTWYVLSFLFFLLGFYSYIGTKLVFLPVILATCFYLYNKNKKQNKRLYVLYSIAALLVVMVSFLLLRLQPTTRLGEIYLPTNARIATQVIETRQATIPFLGESLLLNKLTVYGENVLEKTIASFSLDTLFSHGDMFLGISTHGLFYVIDLLFLLAGLVFVFRKEMRIGVFLVVLLVIGLIPQVLYKEVDLFTPHITFAIPIMVLVIGYGIA